MQQSVSWPPPGHRTSSLSGSQEPAGECWGSDWSADCGRCATTGRKLDPCLLTLLGLPCAVRGEHGETGSWTGSDLWHPLEWGEPHHTEADPAETSLLRTMVGREDGLQNHGKGRATVTRLQKKPTPAMSNRTFVFPCRSRAWATHHWPQPWLYSSLSHHLHLDLNPMPHHRWTKG